MLLEMNVGSRRGRFELAVRDASTGLFGPSGAGKSTILGLIAGTLQPRSGRISLDGKILFDSRKGILVPREQRPVGAVLQHDVVATGETVRASLRSAYERTLTGRRWFKPARLVEVLELGKVLDRDTACLSAGERQRVVLARALLKSPRLLLLDEPFAPLGPNFKTQLLPFLRRVRDELGLPVLYASHSLGDILEITDRLILVGEGRILGGGRLRDVARDAELPELSQIDNVLPITIQSHDTEAGCTLATSYGVELVLPLRPQRVPGSRVQVVVRAGDIALSRHYLRGISIQNQIKGRICALVQTGNSMMVQVDCGTTLLVGITPKAYRDMGLIEGETVYCLAKTQAFGYLGDNDDYLGQEIIKSSIRTINILNTTEKSRHQKPDPSFRTPHAELPYNSA